MTLVADWRECHRLCQPVIFQCCFEDGEECDSGEAIGFNCNDYSSCANVLEHANVLVASLPDLGQVEKACGV